MRSKLEKSEAWFRLIYGLPELWAEDIPYEEIGLEQFTSIKSMERSYFQFNGRTIICYNGI